MIDRISSIDNMYKITQNDLDELIELHELWIDTNGYEGEKLYLWNYDLSNLDVSNRNLREAEFYFCSLENTNFSGSNLIEVELITCRNLKTIITDENTLPKIACPESGEFVGYKKCRVYEKYKYVNAYYEYCVVKLLIPEDAKRSSATTNNCRCSKAYVLGFYDLDGKKIELNENEIIVSCLDHSFEYKLNEYVYSGFFNECRWDECSSGIHFFMTFDEAVDFDWGRSIEL